VCRYVECPALCSCFLVLAYQIMKGATTLSITALSRMGLFVILSITVFFAIIPNVAIFIAMLSVVMLGVVAPYEMVYLCTFSMKSFILKRPRQRY
jgi:hypothetical protein